MRVSLLPELPELESTGSSVKTSCYSGLRYHIYYWKSSTFSNCIETVSDLLGLKISRLRHGSDEQGIEYWHRVPGGMEAVIEINAFDRQYVEDTILTACR